MNQKQYWFSRGRDLIERDSQQALQCFNKAILHDANFAEAYFMKGKALANLYQPEEAKKAFERAA